MNDMCKSCFHNLICSYNKPTVEQCENYCKDTSDYRAKLALNIAFRYTPVNSPERIVDRMVRILCGSEKEYRNFVKAYETRLPNGDKHEWITSNSLEENDSQQQKI